MDRPIQRYCAGNHYLCPCSRLAGIYRQTQRYHSQTDGCLRRTIRIPYRKRQHQHQGHFGNINQRYNKPIILQKYIPESKNGDKRILLLGGKVLGALLRMHEEGEHRNNFFAGGKPMPATITAHDEQIINNLRPHLKKLGLYFVGIDILGDYLIEVNVTSPTCLQEMDRLYNVKLEEKVINFVERINQMPAEASIDLISFCRMPLLSKGEGLP